MKLNVVFIVIFIFSLNSIFSQEIKLDTYILKNSSWTYAHPSIVFDLDFINDSIFKLTYSLESDNLVGDGSYQEKKGLTTYTTGKYKIEDNTLILETNSFFFTDDKPINGFLITNEKLKLFKDSTFLFFNYKIVSESEFMFWGSSYTAKESSIRKIDGNNIFVLKNRTSVLLSKCTISKGPGQKYEHLTIDYIAEFKDNLLSKGWELIILGRSENRENIDDMNDYWYYCKFKVPEYGFEFGWIYGGYIK